MPDGQLEVLFNGIKDRKINDWNQVHAFYDGVQERYSDYKARYSIHLLEKLYDRSISDFTPDIFDDMANDVLDVSNHMLSSSFSSREKDYTDFFRTVTFRNKEEMEAVLGKIEDSSFLQELKVTTAEFNGNVEKLFSTLRKDR